MSRYCLNLLCLAWAAIVASGAFTLARHDLTSGIEAPTAIDSNVLQAARISKGKKTIIMFVHPKCPCSVASLEELRQLMTQYGSQLNATIVMFRSATSVGDWTQSIPWATAREIPGVTVREDLDGTLAKECGAQTSGQVFLYDEHGTLEFEGGITGSRGHVGNNNSLDTLASLISENSRSHLTSARTPVFGCAIYPGNVTPVIRK